MNIYPENFEQKIDFDTIRHYLREYCLSPLGIEKVDSMFFSTDFNKISNALICTSEFLQIVAMKESFPTDYFLDIRADLQQVEKDSSAWLSEKDISLLADSLETIIRIVDFLSEQENENERLKYPMLSKLGKDVKLFSVVVERANSILDKSNQIKDNASKLLSTIRKGKIEAEKDIVKAMTTALRQAQKQGIVDRDVQADVRGGYYLIPVTATNKKKIKGIVRDSSGSGRTFFIEPEAVVQASSRLRQLENDERREVIYILNEFTNFIRPDIDDILVSYDFMAEIDFIRAKALFASKINATMPLFENRQQVEWERAVHPLLEITLRQQNMQARPLDIQLTPTDRILVVSGVNAGGKSLCLKTVALLQYMLQCGLLIPVAPESKAGIFHRLFMDIGDGQSVENSLSTYTSHLRNMKFFVENHNDKTLMLIDEFGGGTEPQIGGAIAETLLDRFNSKKSFGLITTHFQNLKHFAYRTAGVINGAMLYDSENNRPMYKLSIGTPGSSFAIEVARRIGLEETIIVEASNKIGKEFVNIDEFLQAIARDKLYWENRGKEITESKSQRELTSELTMLQIEPSRSAESLDVSLTVGDKVTMVGQTVVGTILEISGRRATVVFGTLKTKMAVDKLQVVR
ncbi:DNA mismatch repair protein MutS2 [Sphingobacterium nematocida]|uniref:DNA mismatch repair protein MutS2 n=1 Tax=Sphingobacterium nematocida TaxID=1513896 RepID=A0A1T5APU7_9SPHI|nr:endonuclease MutS2 [Sphingobacterium nematocida]SKB36613.1 DNA mismatch repair protein MutS2 [Sphingobacterium nematocida]